MNTENKKLGILIYDQVQPMDVIGPWEVFSTWKNLLGTPLEMYLVSENAGEVGCVNQLSLKSHCNINNSPQFDYLLIPGGPGRVAQMENGDLLRYIKTQAETCEYIMSVCTGVFLLYKAGLLTNHQVTTYWRAIPELNEFGDVNIAEKRIVKSGRIWTTGGVSSGIDLALEFISEIAGKETAGKVQLLFEYFPNNTLYCTGDMLNDLPSYTPQTRVSKIELPDYIKKYIQNRD